MTLRITLPRPVSAGTNLALVAVLFLMAACTDVDSSLTATPPAQNAAVTTSGENTHFHKSASALLAPILICNNELIKFTTEGEGLDSSLGDGATLNDAVNNTVENAIVHNVLEQFTCDNCPDTGPCEPFWDPETVDTAGAFYEGDPATDCRQREDGTWACHGDVNFNTGSRKAPSVQVGCKTCEDSWLPIRSKVTQIGH